MIKASCQICVARMGRINAKLLRSALAAVLVRLLTCRGTEAVLNSVGCTCHEHI